MLKYTSVTVLALFILSSTALAICNPFAVSGTYVRQVSPYLDQLILSLDGRASWFNTGSFDQFFLGGFSPEVGSWTCLADGSVLVTTVGAEYSQNSPFGDVPQPGQPLDINIFDNLRFTQKLSIIDRDTLQQTHRTSTRTDLSADPLGPGAVRACSPTGTPCNPAPYRRVKPTASDIQ